MARAPYRPDPDKLILERHRAWLGLLQPEGLVVSAAALREAGLVVDQAVLDLRDRLVALRKAAPDQRVAFPTLAEQLLGWRPRELVLPTPSQVYAVPEFPGDLLAPSHVLNDLAGEPQLLVQVVHAPPDVDATSDHLDAATDLPGRWPASPQSRFERLLRESQIALGVLYDGLSLRLVYAPRGETSGHLTFPLALMTTADGRVVLGALRMLLGQYRLFPGSPDEHLLALCTKSREYQNTVSTALADQVLDALNELLHGFARADQAQSDVAARVLSRAFEGVADDGAPDRVAAEHVYGGLLTTIMRLVFLLYAEERGLLPDAALYQQGYSVRRLYERLREDHGRHPDSMDQRHGAWPQLLALFRMVHNGVQSQAFSLPRRDGELFDPDRYPFLEGRLAAAQQTGAGRLQLPRVSDGTLYRILHNLVMLGGERLSYRALAVEQIGSVYQNMMGFEVKRAAAPMLSLTKLAVPVELEALLAVPGPERKRWLDAALKPDKVGTRVAAALAEATDLDALEAALLPMASRLTPARVPAGGFYLEPTDERRRSGTHYTPQALTGPIVKKTLEPILADLATTPRAVDGVPHPDDLLDLKICDPAMGSAAFLVEVCRQLGAALEVSWQKHGKPRVRRADGREEALDPSVETLIHAQRYVAERCVYGVDKNAFAVSLGKLSLWIATLAKERAFTFVDDSIRHGDSLVGLTRAQLGAFSWEQIEAKKGKVVETHPWVKEKVAGALKLREQIVKQQGSDDYQSKRGLLDDAEAEMRDVRLLGDACVASYFAGTNDRERKSQRDRLAQAAQAAFEDGDRAARLVLEQAQAELRGGERPLVPFHWEVEFPEVFHRANPGFDGFVGNPPFVGGKRISTTFGFGYRDWLALVHVSASSNADLVAHFFRRGFGLLRQRGTEGLIATNTISQGETRESGLTWIRAQGGEIFAARRRYRWPGAAAVVVSVCHIRKAATYLPIVLDDVAVDRITAYLLSAGRDDSPVKLKRNADLSYIGFYLNGMGFTFDDAASRATASSISVMHEALARNPHGRECVSPLIGGEEVNSSPSQSPDRYAINFGTLDLPEVEGRWPELLEIVRTRVKPDRDKANRDTHRTAWWRYGDARPALAARLKQRTKVLVNSQVSAHLSFALQPTDRIFAHTLNVFALDTYAAFAALQCRVHEVWALLNASSLEDRLRYTPTDCFETFPFPPGWQTDPGLEAAGKAYYEHRAALMITNDEGLTKTYNRFHDEANDEPGIVALRALHAAMDLAMIRAYGWDPAAFDLTCRFLPIHTTDDDDEDDGKPVKKRLRWSDETRDLVLAKLLELNEQYAKGPASAAPEAFTLAAPEPGAGATAGKGKRASRKKGGAA